MSTLPMPSDIRSSQGHQLTDLTVDIPTSHRPPKSSPSRWRTPEFYLYYVAFAVAIPLMVYTPYNLSRDTSKNFPLYQHRLANGWIPGRQVDNSDAQYRSFRNNIPALTVLAVAFLALKQSVAQRLPSYMFTLGFSIAMIIGLHGTSSLKILAILLLNYTIAVSGRGASWTPIATWVFNGLMLYSNEVSNGYKFEHLSPGLGFLDSWSGIYPRWHISFNITMLRLVSFNMDYYWAHKTKPSELSSEATEKERAGNPHELSTYTFRNYLLYTLYAPLYIAGPIMTFNDFMYQQRAPLQVSSKSVRAYLYRFLASLLTMELILHFMYVVAIKDAKAWNGSTPFELSMIGFWNLMVVWLKLLIPWRFFRLWALADGIDPPENMVRCMANNYSTMGFWRSWHRSYNLWLVRYIYIPLGGGGNVVVSTALIFTFVALWHDLSFRLLAWGWLVSLFILPEIIATKLLPSSKYETRWWYRHVCALGGVFNVFLMISANLIGFVIGTDGFGYMLSQLTSSWDGLTAFVVTTASVFCGVQVMFEYRAHELRNGISRRC